MTPPPTNSYPGLIVSAPSSRAGKTTVALGLMRALKQRGHSVQAYKSGPDYIDTGFHKAATHRDSINLDTWAMHQHTIQRLIENASSDAAISIVEGAMGLFDGAATPGQFKTGTTADLAALTGWPVVLVLDVARQAATAAAIVKGCATYRDDVNVCAVILNNVASERHEHLVKGPIEALGIPVVASLRRTNDVSLPERHLGLKQADETKQLEKILAACAGLFDGPKHTDIASAVMKLATPARFATPNNNAPANARAHDGNPPGQTIALARDEAFSFVYAHMLQRWAEQGAQVLPFSPLADEPPSKDADAVWLPGGYPELHAGKLSAAQNFKDGMRTLSAKGIPIHGECGGYMVLGQGLVDANGDRHAMLGLLDLETSFATRKLHLGYRKSHLKSDCVLGRAGKTVFGHEFHYATILKNNDPPLADVFDAQGARVEASGSKRDNITGTFFHLIDRQWQRQ